MRKNIPNLFVILAILLASFSPVFVSAVEAQGSEPTIVNIPGTHQDELGCPGEWQPECESTLLTYDIEDDVWQGTYEIQPANNDDKKGPRYKAAINGGWGENYGINATLNGQDIPLLVTEPTPYYRIVVTDSDNKRDGRFLENVGTSTPKPTPSRSRSNRSGCSTG